MNIEVRNLEENSAAMNWIIQLAKTKLDVEKIILFGSRNTEMHRATSDIDLAFVYPIKNQENWSAFVADCNDEAPTLLELDLVDFRNAQQELKDSISRTGKIIYERT